MLNIKEPEYFNKVCAWAEKTGRSEYLWKQLMYLHTFADGFDHGETPPFTDPMDYKAWCKGTKRVDLYRDSAPASFYFVIFSKPEPTSADLWFNGGLIYHGNQAGWERPDGSVIQPTEREETFSVRLGQSENPWSVHT